MLENNAGLSWIEYALLTVVCWGLYGPSLHSGQIAMGDPVNGRYKAFLFVGVAYFFVAVLAPLGMLLTNGASMKFSLSGISWSVFAGSMGALGAFFVLRAFGAGGSPAVVMAIIFAGAPIVNAAAAYSLHPPVGGLQNLRWQFVLGIVLAAAAGLLVTRYSPTAVAAQLAAKPPVSEAQAELGN